MLRQVTLGILHRVDYTECTAPIKIPYRITITNGIITLYSHSILLASTYLLIVGWLELEVVCTA